MAKEIHPRDGTRRCKNCVAWYASVCRCNAPVPDPTKGDTEDESIGIWPTTNRMDWCQQWQPIPKEQGASQ